MKYERIFLAPDRPDVFLEVFAANAVGTAKRKALLVFPGGGYAGVCADREGEPIALAFMPHGYNAFVLHYTVGRKRKWPAQLIEAALAIKHIKDNADVYNIDPEQVFTVGFSAGGHLAAASGVLWKHPAVYEAVDMPYGYNKPAGVMPIYAVVSAACFQQSFANLLCNDSPTQTELEPLSIERHVDADSAPAFIMHTADDEIVSCRHALALASAYADAGRPFEMHIYPHAPHGVALGNSVTDCGKDGWNNAAIARWVEHAAYWAAHL